MNGNYHNRVPSLIDVFADTVEFYTSDAQLANAVQQSKNNTKFYDENDMPQAINKSGKAGEVSVTKEKTFEAAMRLRAENEYSKIAVLNFASATNPGGGVKHGAHAQEESLCRCSTLFPTLDRRFLWQKYYDVNRAANNALHTDACIYSPKIVICKTDDSVPKRMPSEKWVTVDVISCAAPNLREKPSNMFNPSDGTAVSVTTDEQYNIHKQRAQHIFAVAAANGVDILVLGAFGCGAFANDAKSVAKAYRDTLDEYKTYFDKVVFAVYCRDFETENYDAFADILK